MRAMLVVVAAAVACDGATSDPGAAASFQVAGAQFAEGAPPDPSGGPEVASLGSLRPVVRIGDFGERIRANLAASSEAALLWLEGDAGYWIVPADPPLAETPDYPSIDVQVGLATAVEPGPVTIEARAVDGAGRVGPPRTLSLTAEVLPPIEGALVISLGWDTDSDLDLHVVTPDGSEVWSGDPNSYEPPGPGEPPDPPDAWQEGGILDVDSNSGCRIDGRRRENVIWQAEPPPGVYTVRVDTFSLCGESHAYWVTGVFRDGESLEEVEGVSLPSDADLPHGRGAGVTALEIEIE